MIQKLLKILKRKKKEQKISYILRDTEGKEISKGTIEAVGNESIYYFLGQIYNQKTNLKQSET